MGLFVKNVAVLALAAGVAMAGFGCEKSRDEMRPDMDRVMSGDHGPQSRDLREMAQRLAPDLLQINEIKNSPYKITVVMKHMDNKTEDRRGRDMDIYVVELAGLLRGDVASTQIQFVEEWSKTLQLQQEELGNADPTEDRSRNPNAPDTRIKPQYALYGTVYSMVEGRTSFYVIEFKLVNILTSAFVWSRNYDVRTLN
ncbi:MAG TPA: hypothetical protein VGN88_10630 [Phycisphaerae bacterium]|jgi:hypothetical protein